MGFALAEAGQRAEGVVDLLGRDLHGQHVAADESFSSWLVPRAMTVPWSRTTMPSASWSASSRYCVVSSTVRRR